MLAAPNRERVIISLPNGARCRIVEDDGHEHSLEVRGSVRERIRVHHDSLLFQATLRPVVPPFRSRVMRVVDERGDPIANASLLDNETGEVRETTNANGEASLTWLPRGRASEPVVRPGYSPTSATIHIAPDDSTTVVVSMHRVP